MDHLPGHIVPHPIERGPRRVCCWQGARGLQCVVKQSWGPGDGLTWVLTVMLKNSSLSHSQLRHDRGIFKELNTIQRNSV